MAVTSMYILLFMSFISSSISSGPADEQFVFFTLLKSNLSGSPLSYWGATEGSSYCDYSGIGCDERGYVTVVDVSGWSISGEFPPGVCSYLPKLRVLQLGHNHLHGNFPRSIISCSLLEVLNISKNHLDGVLPDFSPMRSLRVLDLSYNRFTGEFPLSVANLTNLEELVVNMNEELNYWKLPAHGFPRLQKLKTMILTSCMLNGEIPPSIGNMTSLHNLQLSGNDLVGQIPKELGLLRNLQLLELYYNHLVGGIPEELGNLSRLVDLDMSVNKLTGDIPESICRLPQLQVLQLYNNSLTGEIPVVIANSTTLNLLSLYRNFLTGKVPPALGKSSPVIVIDLSENRLSGELPPDICKGGRLLYFLMLDNIFSGTIPNTYANCKTLIRFRVSNNRLEGSIPQQLLGLPHVSILDLGFNHLTGVIAPTIGNARNLSELYIPGNRISGTLPPEISQVTSLAKIDLSNNFLSGRVPLRIGNLKRLTLLLLQGNKFNSSIPESMSELTSLSFLDLSSNLLTGNIPESLCKLLANSISINFSNNMLSGPIPLPMAKDGQLDSFSSNPGLCIPAYLNLSNSHLSKCSHTNRKTSFFWAVGLSAVFAVVGVIMFLFRVLNKRRTHQLDHDESFSSSNISFDVKSFHRLSFDQHEIVKGMVDKNVVGHGGSGTVYKIELSKGEAVAVKKLWSRKTKDPAAEEQLCLDKGMKTEVETLGSVRHKNIVKLYCYFKSSDCSLLVYEYMPNGNLWDALHTGWVLLDWPTRHQIALGIAQGLAYLHHDLLPPIIHRDIKSTNILLDANYEPKVADFGIAKVLQARAGKDTTTSTAFAGTYGYLAPEYAYSSKATIKCDVYSFGVVLMELITGRKPVEAEFGENKNIMYWVSSKVETKEGVLEVLDKKLSGSFDNEMIHALRIAMRCTCRTPALRPNMTEVVKSLTEASPCKSGSFKDFQKTNKQAKALQAM